MDMNALKELARKLSAPFPVDVVKWRVQGRHYKRGDKNMAKVVSYIDARDVMKRLDDVMTPGGWQNTIHTGEIVGRSGKSTQQTVVGIGILIPDVGWVWKYDGSDGADTEEVKAGFSDGLKRAAVLWGIGRYMYDIKVQDAEVQVNERNGKEYVDFPRNLWPQLPEWAKPVNMTHWNNALEHSIGGIKFRELVEAGYEQLYSFYNGAEKTDQKAFAALKYLVNHFKHVM